MDKNANYLTFCQEIAGYCCIFVDEELDRNNISIENQKKIIEEFVKAKFPKCKLKAKPEWSIVTIQEILSNDFYIGTLRRHKYTRKKIYGVDTKVDESEHFVFENHHEAIIDYKTWAYMQEQLKKKNYNTLSWRKEIRQCVFWFYVLRRLWCTYVFHEQK